MIEANINSCLIAKNDEMLVLTMHLHHLHQNLRLRILAKTRFCASAADVTTRDLWYAATAAIDGNIRPAMDFSMKIIFHKPDNSRAMNVDFKLQTRTYLEG